jgi:hypothetical protein
MSDLLKINVSDHIEKKNGLSYLSWAYAWTEVLKIDPQATWYASEYGPQGSEVPYMQLPDGSCMVRVFVTIKGHAKSCMLPVMNHRNQAIKGPDAFAVNTAVMRCLAKAISMHGLGLYIYAGEDLPEADEVKPTKISPVPDVDLTADQTEFVEQFRHEIVQEWLVGNELGVIDMWYRTEIDNDVRTAVWKALAQESKLRAFIKANKPESKAA